jgi:hypothetical protein
MTLKFLVLHGAPYIYDISRLTVKSLRSVMWKSVMRLQAFGAV